MNIVKGTVKNTGWPIDGHTLYFSQWEYDNYGSWHLAVWDNDDDEAVMETMFETESEYGMCLYDTLEEFKEAWKKGEWEPQGAFTLPLNQVEIVEVKS